MKALFDRRMHLVSGLAGVNPGRNAALKPTDYDCLNRNDPVLAVATAIKLRPGVDRNGAQRWHQPRFGRWR